MTVNHSNSIDERIQILLKLKQYLLSDDNNWDEIYRKAELANPWFVFGNIEKSIDAICNKFLEKESLTQWVSDFSLPNSKKRIGIVMAGNIPLVGFADWLAVFICGHEAMVKLSDKDTVLFTAIIQWLELNYGKDLISTTIVNRLTNYEAVIATGSDNSAIYFEQYFGHVPHLIRRNRTSVGILHGDESSEMLMEFWEDIHSYFGLGCRNVTYLALPDGFNPVELLKIWDQAPEILHHKYKNNYDYNLAISMLNGDQFYYNENILLIDQPTIHSRIASVSYQYYSEMNNLELFLHEQRNNIQCLVSTQPVSDWQITIPGNTQNPSLTDYADNVNTLQFLCNL